MNQKRASSEDSQPRKRLELHNGLIPHDDEHKHEWLVPRGERRTRVGNDFQAEIPALEPFPIENIKPIALIINRRNQIGEQLIPHLREWFEYRIRHRENININHTRKQQ